MDAWCWLLLVLVHGTQGSHDVVVTLNTLRPVTQTSDHFLGLSISPRHILNLTEYSVGTVNMLRALSPGFLRVGGSESNNLAFTPMNTSADYLFTENQWNNINLLAAETGLQLIFSLSSESQKGQSQLLKYSDDKAYDVTWQLGYCTKNNGTNEVQSKELIQEISNIHRLIDSFPRYRNAATLSPDLEFCEEPGCQEVHKDLLLQISDDVDIIVLQLKPTQNLKDVKNMFGKLDKLTNEIEKMYFSRGIIVPREKDSYRNNIWLDEAENADQSRELFTFALTLGITSQLGFHTLLMNLEHLSQPSHGYWTALLWRALVGRTVIGSRVWPQDAEVAVFAACTETRPQPSFDMEWEYDSGAVTVWGVNPGEESVAVSIVFGSQLDHMHMYTLTEADHSSGDTLLNGRPLRLVHGVLPRLNPRVRSMSRTKSVTVPAKSVFFIVLPDAQIPICRSNSDEKYAVPVKKEDGSSLSLNSPLFSSKTSIVSGNSGVKLDNILFEKGGVFTDESEIKKSLDKSSGIRTETKNNIKDMIEDLLSSGDKYVKTTFDQNVKTNNNKNPNKLPSFSESNAEQQVPSLSKINVENYLKDSIENVSEDPKQNAQLNNLIGNQKKYNTPLLTSGAMKESLQLSSNITKSMENNKTLDLNKTLETVVPRVKRSEYLDYYKESGSTDIETSPLYRRVNLLRRILDKLQQTTQIENEEQNKNFGDLTGPAYLEVRKNKNKSEKTGTRRSGFSDGVDARINYHVNKEQSSSRVVKNHSDENINYYPGEFYEVLGDLKLDSNVSLKNIEATGSLKNQSEQNCCNKIKSKLIVYKKSENDPQEDERLVEQATENLRHYYMLRSNSISELEGKQGGKVEHFEGRSLKNEGNKIPAIISIEDMSKDLEGKENYEESLTTKISLKRNERDLYQLGDEDNDEKTEYPDEVEMSHFLEELTNEGEQLLQTIDEDYEMNTGNLNNITSSKQISNEQSLPHLDQNTSIVIVGDDLLSKNKKDLSDYYLKNNILTDKDIKPKRKYSYMEEQTFDYNMLDKSTDSLMSNNMADKNQFSTTNVIAFGSEKSNIDSSTNEPSLITDLTTSSGITYSNKILSGKSVTEAINNSDMYIESIIPQNDKTTKPGINFTSVDKLLTPIELFYNQKTNFTNETSKIREGMAKESTKIENNFFVGNITNDLKVKSGDLSVSTSVKKESDTSIISEDSTNKDQLFDKKSFKQDPVPKTVNLGQKSEKSEKKEGDTKQMIHSYIQARPIEVVKSILDVNIPHTIIGNSSDKTKKIDSESKLENKILPPPSKPLLISHTLSVPSSYNLGSPKKVDATSKKITEFNNKNKLTVPVPVLEKSLKINTSISDRYKERLEAIKQKLQKAREQLLNVTSARAARLKMPSNILKPKREIISNKGILNSLLNKGQENKEYVQAKTNEFDSTTKQEINSLNSSLSLENFHLIHRLKRQVHELKKRETLSSVENRQSISSDQAVDVDAISEGNIQPPSNINIPFYFPGLRKWIIPLSNSTENMLYKSKMFPVNLYGIISDKWVKENVGGSSDNKEKRKRRNLKYPCVRDKYNDFEAEDESDTYPRSANVENGKQDLPSKTVKYQGASVRRRRRRTTSKDIEMNELEMKALLTNEIVKDKPTNDIPSHENVFSSMLHKTLSKTLANKTGIERMLELAKKYQETNPSSVEVFSTKKKTKGQNISGENEKLDGENVSTEITSSKNNEYGFPTLNKGQENNTISEITTYKGETEVKNVSTEESTTVDRSKNNVTPKTDDNLQEDTWFDFISKIQDFFESITNEVKKSIQ